jgi:hypothetical protein
VVVLANLPVVLNVPRQGSPRTFAPTWLVLTAVIALVGQQVAGRHVRLVGLAGGVFVAGALLSLLLTVVIRLDAADVVQAAARELATATADGDRVALCHVPRSVSPLAPRGAFQVQDFLYDWAAMDATLYYTGRDVRIQSWPEACPSDPSPDLKVDFADLAASGRVAP